MSILDASPLHTVSFGDAEGKVWGTALSAGATALIAGGGAGAAGTWELGADGWRAADGAWTMAGDGVELRVEPVAAQAGERSEQLSPSAVAAAQELCRIRGVVRVDGAERRIDCVGARSAIDGARRGAPPESLRAVTGWFDADEAFALVALRGSGSPGQESDVVAATLFDPEGPVPVADPRLSTTYDGAGRPSRVTLELWIPAGDGEVPRRAAGEAAGSGAAVSAGGITLRAVPLRCHSRGRDGAGIYLLAAA